MDILKGIKREILHAQAEHNFKSTNFRAALDEYKALFGISTRLGEGFTSAYYCERIGDCFEKLDHKGNKERNEDHKNAGEYYIKSAELYKKLKDFEKAGEVYEKGAKAYEEIDDFKAAGGFYNTSAVMFSEVQDYVNASYAYQSAAQYFDKDSEYAEAAKAYQESAVCDMK
ncbi:MAG: hypothetical protein NTU61_06630, partial [Candidatus Altiarchaeota archaeon]|nr:hypothetical protein [Candidatus Altiarchaeota archaeon]